jgi:hypothetical protein
VARGAIGSLAGPAEGALTRGDVRPRDDRLLARQRFRQVAPATDETFVSRVALRRLCTQVVSDHFFGVIVAAVNGVEAKSGSTVSRSRKVDGRISDLLVELQQLVCERSTDESIEMSVTQLRGVAEWDVKERYPSLDVFARDERAQASFAKARSGQDAPALFERLLAQTKRTDRPLPKIYYRIWDDTYWWADLVCSRTLGALLQLCLNRNIQFYFRGNLSLIDLNAAAITRLNQRWQIVLCSEAVREAAKHVARTLSMPMVFFSIPIVGEGVMQGFDPDLIELRNQNALIRDSLVCFPSDHPAATPLAQELIRRSDVIDVLASASERASRIVLRE